jgi:hypothetical protein
MSFRRKLELIGFYTTSLLQNSREAIGRVRERMEAFNSLSGYAYDEEYSLQNVPVGIEEPQRRRFVASGAANEN